jgi:hypothetical protein
VWTARWKNINRGSKKTRKKAKKTKRKRRKKGSFSSYVKQPYPLESHQAL